MNWPSEIKLITRELPVVYNIVKNQIYQLWEEEQPDVLAFKFIFFKFK